jgi:hypothetical protein
MNQKRQKRQETYHQELKAACEEEIIHCPKSRDLKMSQQQCLQGGNVDLLQRQFFKIMA